MAGLLSRMFESESTAGQPRSEGGSADNGAQPRTEGSDEREQQARDREAEQSGSDEGASNETSSGARQDVDVEAEVDLSASIHSEGTYRDLEGDETYWSRDQHLETHQDFSQSATTDPVADTFESF